MYNECTFPHRAFEKKFPIDHVSVHSNIVPNAAHTYALRTLSELCPARYRHSYWSSKPSPLFVHAEYMCIEFFIAPTWMRFHSVRVHTTHFQNAHSFIPADKPWRDGCANDFYMCCFDKFFVRMKPKQRALIEDCTHNRKAVQYVHERTYEIPFGMPCGVGEPSTI